MDIHFEGEHLLYGRLGQLSVYTAFIFALVAAVSFFISSYSKDAVSKKSWKRAGQTAFFIQALAVFSIVVNL